MPITVQLGAAPDIDRRCGCRDRDGVGCGIGCRIGDGCGHGFWGGTNPSSTKSLGKVARKDRALADQIRRSASSIALNIGEGRYSRGGTPTARFENAMGSASETRSALRVAEAWGYISSRSLAELDSSLDRIVALLRGLTRKKRR